jgi:hypothetical protein
VITGGVELNTAIRISRHLLSHELVAFEIQSAEIELNLASNLGSKVLRHC